MATDTGPTDARAAIRSDSLPALTSMKPVAVAPTLAALKRQVLSLSSEENVVVQHTNKVRSSFEELVSYLLWLHRDSWLQYQFRH